MPLPRQEGFSPLGRVAAMIQRDPDHPDLSLVLWATLRQPARDAFEPLQRPGADIRAVGKQEAPDPDLTLEAVFADHLAALVGQLERRGISDGARRLGAAC